MEDYVAQVLSGEGQPKAAPAAQEALAIVIRTFALANRQRHRAEGYDLCDTTHCQVMRPALPAARAAAAATAGRVLLDRGRPAFVFYSAHNGGTPALASEVWPGAVDYVPGDPHDACDDEPGWTLDLTTAEVERILRTAGLSGRSLKDLAIVDRTASGRAGRMRAGGFTPGTLAAHEFRMAAGRVLGARAVRSTAFDLSRTRGGYRLDGVGYGHGVGLCVVGAGKRAARGEDTATILHAYFRDLVISGTPVRSTSAAPPVLSAPPAPVRPATPAPPVAPAALAATDIRITLPPFEEHERAMVLGLARRTRDEVAARALVKAPAVITIQVHPSMDAFGHATGQPWWVPGATVGTAIDLAPIAQLRQRGVLESALRFEVASAVVAPHLLAAPAWVRVGAAMLYTAPDGAAPPADGGRLVCPTDAELFQPVSGGAQREAMLRAQRCVMREIARGRRLTDLR
ncbi:MAG: SpoIID/LytB domain-containing protein [Vicinamibacterales bacterium]